MPARIDGHSENTATIGDRMDTDIVSRMVGSIAELADGVDG